LAAEGAHIAICARNAAEVEDTVTALRREGVTSFGQAIDVSDAAALKSWVAASALALGGIDIVVPNVSALAIAGSEAWQKSFATDLMGSVGMVEAAMPYLEKSDAASIVIISSVSGREGRGASLMSLSETPCHHRRAHGHFWSQRTTTNHVGYSVGLFSGILWVHKPSGRVVRQA
jgi:NAD(P)-dependent dehydrogenase (short-subunit alcohol dehydrogenase family)